MLQGRACGADWKTVILYSFVCIDDGIALLVVCQVSGGVATQKLSFSSYPGELFSDDDFYITGAQLVVLETTNHIYNFSVYEVSVPCGSTTMSDLFSADGC